MSKHWNPDGTPWVTRDEFRAMTPAQVRQLYAERAAVRRGNSRSESRRIGLRPKFGRQAVVTTMLAAIFVGLIVGIMLVGSEPAPSTASVEAHNQPVTAHSPSAQPASVRPATDAADMAWERRAEEEDGAPARAKGAGAIRASFTYCYSGGGTNCVVDGDTFYLNGAKVRIAGIDAPETHPPRCAEEARLGNEATSQLHDLLNSGAVTMTSIDRDRDVYGRLLRNVAVNGADVGEAMVSAGVEREYAGGRRPWC